MRNYSILSMIVLALILAAFVALVPKFPDIKSIDLRRDNISEVFNANVQEKLE